MMSKRPLSIFSMFTAIGFFIFTISSIVIAQGRYANVYSRNQVSEIIRNAEDSSDRFRTDFRNQMNQNYGLSNSQKNQYNNNVARCEEALDRLRDHFNKNNSWWESRNQVQDVVNASQNVNTMMNVLPFRRNLENQWRQLRNSINTLADTFDLPGLNGGGWNGGGGAGYPGGGYPGGQTSSPPSWARGTFYGRSPQDGTRIVMTINNNGRITANVGGNSTYGTYYRGSINIDGAIARITQTNYGIRSTRVDNGEVIELRRTDNGNNGGVWDGGNNGGNWGGGNTSAPPSWAQGVFFGTAPDGSQITFTLSSEGRVTANIGGSMSYGSYYQGTININGASSRITQTRNGIRSTRVDNGEVIELRRR